MEQIIKAVILVSILLTMSSVGCKSVVYYKPELPAFALERPERPQITEKSEDTIKLMRYSMLLENDLDTWKEFYDNLRKN